jgi:poly-beta-1,6-N-acetyl-D-glucosamine synthase
MNYVLITPARDEAEFIELTIRSIVNQTIRPLHWLIVSDGSTDGTDAIVERYCAKHDWMQLMRMSPRNQRDFGGKARSFNAGWDRLKALPCDLVGNIDADLSFEPTLFEFLLAKFAENPRLGLAGAPFNEGQGTYDYRFSSVQHVSGACQLFRRQCFEDIQGYTPLKGGGIDVLAVLTARMKGWETRTFPEKVCIHHRTMGRSRHEGIRAHLALGEKDYVLGRHPLWELCRAIYQLWRRPFIVGGLLLFMGYVWAALRRVERPMPPEVIAFQRAEQMHRLRSTFVWLPREIVNFAFRRNRAQPINSELTTPSQN